VKYIKTFGQFINEESLPPHIQSMVDDMNAENGRVEAWMNEPKTGVSSSSSSTSQKNSDRRHAAIAPDGTQTKLSIADWEMVRTKEFKDWFGDWENAFKTKNYDDVSDMVGDNGEPIMLYHIAKASWATFDMSKASDPSTQADMGFGLYFADKNNIDEWKHHIIKSANVNPVQMRFFANVRRLKVVADGYLDCEEARKDNDKRDYNEQDKYDAKIEGTLQEIQQGVIFEPNKNIRVVK